MQTLFQLPATWSFFFHFMSVVFQDVRFYCCSKCFQPKAVWAPFVSHSVSRFVHSYSSRILQIQNLEFAAALFKITVASREVCLALLPTLSLLCFISLHLVITKFSSKFNQFLFNVFSCYFILLQIILLLLLLLVFLVAPLFLQEFIVFIYHCSVVRFC